MRTTHKNLVLEPSIRLEEKRADVKDLDVIKAMVRYRQELLPDHSRRELLEVSIDVLKEAVRLEELQLKHGYSSPAPNSRYYEAE